MPEEARLWIFSALRPFSSEEKEAISSAMRAFCEQWDSHGSPLSASFRIDQGQFILLTVDDRHLGPGGCSIDKSFHMIRSLEARWGHVLLERDRVAVKKGDDLEMIRLKDLKEKILGGEITAETQVFDTTVNTLGEWLAHGCVRAGDSWLKRYWPAEQTPA